MADERDDVIDGSAPQAEVTGDVEGYDGIGRDISKVIEAASKTPLSTDEPAKPAVPKEATPVALPQTTAEAQKAVARAWKAYKDGVEFKDFDPSKMTAAEFLKLKIGYNANGKEQQRDFEGLVRNAQLGHYNADKTIRLEQEREHALRSWHEAKEQVTQFEADRNLINHALLQAARQNYEPLRTLVQEFSKAYDTVETPAAPAEAPEGYISAEEVERQNTGTAVFNETVWPKALELAQQYPFTPEQIATAVMEMVERYPSEFFNKSVLDSIINVELPGHMQRILDERGETVAPESTVPAVPVTNAEQKRIAELEAQVAHLSSKTVEQDNAAVLSAHNRRKAAPPGVPSVVAGAGEDGAPEFKTAAEARAWAKSGKWAK